VNPEENIIYTEDDFSYTVSSGGAAVITRYTGKGGTLTLPAVLGGKRVRRIGRRAFYCNPNIRRVTLPDGIISIGSGAFQMCVELKSITLPETLTSIGEMAFLGCYSLPEINLPEGLTSIGDSAFNYCRNLKSVYLPGSVSRIVANPFRHSPALTRIETAPGSPYEFYDGALFYKPRRCLVSWLFSNTGSSCTVPYGTEAIGIEAFGSCAGLMHITLPETLTSISSAAFADCIGLTSIYLPGGVRDIGANPFQGCEHLDEIKTAPGSPYLEVIGGALISRADRRLVAFPSGKRGGLYAVPDGVRYIGDRAFYNCSFNASVTIPSEVRAIGNEAFVKCSGLTRVCLPEGLEHIGEMCFSYCTGLEAVTLPGSLQTAGAGAFHSCSRLTADVIQNSFAARYCRENHIKTHIYKP